MSSGRTPRTLGLSLAAAVALAAPASAQAPPPTVVDPALAVSPVVEGLEAPVGMAFLGPGDMLVIEKGTGRVRRVTQGTVRATVLDLPVNSASERGLLGVVLHPDFASNGLAYLFWTESTTGADSSAVAEVPLLGNRVDRYRWDGSTLAFDRTVVRLRAYQADEGQPVRGNHNGGVLRFGSDGRLYVVVGDGGRRGQLQNLLHGPFGPGLPDDAFGGPDPDAAHLTGAILRLDEDGAPPEDNPFYELGAERGGEVGRSLQSVFAYGLRNSFGLAVDPYSGDLWEQENGDDSFSELNRVEPGMNSGWVQIMGPPERVAEFRAIETDRTAPRPNASNGYFGLQQIRWSPESIASTPQEALDRLVRFPGSRYSAPELSWRYEVAPGGIGFLEGDGLGRGYRGDLFVGSARAALLGGNLFRLELSRDRREVAPSDPRLEDRVADNGYKYDVTESESLVFGRDFGVITDVHTGPDGALYVVSLSRGAVYRVAPSGR
jgi:glucose/arabinose dehydrogenase